MIQPVANKINRKHLLTNFRSSVLQYEETKLDSTFVKGQVPSLQFLGQIKTATSCIEKKIPQIVFAILALITTDTRETKNGTLSLKYRLIDSIVGTNKDIFSTRISIKKEITPDKSHPKD